MTLDQIRCGEIVNITITSNTTFNVSVPYNYKIYLLKQEIAARLHKDGSQFSLQYTNIELEETSSLDAYHIQNKSNIYVLENTVCVDLMIDSLAWASTLYSLTRYAVFSLLIV